WKRLSLCFGVTLPLFRRTGSGETQLTPLAADLHRPRRDAIHGDVPGAELDRERSRQAEDAGLVGGVCRNSAPTCRDPWTVGRTGRGIHDSPPADTFHRPDRRANAEICPAERHAHRAVPQLFGEILHRHSGTDPRMVDEDPDVAELTDRRLDEAL